MEMVNVNCFCEAKLIWNANLRLVSILHVNYRCQMLWAAFLIRLISHKTCVLQPCKNVLAAHFSVWLSANDQVSMWQTWKQSAELTADDLCKVIGKETIRARQDDWHKKHNAEKHQLLKVQIGRWIYGKGWFYRSSVRIKMDRWTRTTSVAQLYASSSPNENTTFRAKLWGLADDSCLVRQEFSRQNSW